jgi:RimJ/RimL family protein N-acetyltransferase
MSTAPPPTARLRLREMDPDDLDRMAALLGDPVVMAHYPAACRDHARDVLRAPGVSALIAPANIPSQRVAEHLGMTRRAPLRSGTLHYGIEF